VTSAPNMTVIVTGANSAVGRTILKRRCGEGTTQVRFLAAVRSDRAAKEIRSDLGDQKGVVQISYDDPSSLDAAFQGALSVIHVAGILVERRNSSYEQANVEPTRSVVQAAKRNRIQKFVLVSAIGADPNSENRYYRTKGLAEDLVRTSGLAYTIIRVPLLLGAGTAGAVALRRNVQHAKAKLIDGGNYRQQPLHVDDLARAAVIVATRLTTAENEIMELVGPCPLTERELVERAARCLGRTVRIGSVSKSLLSFALAIRERLGRTGFSRDVLQVVTEETCVDPQPAARKLGIELTGIDQMIRDSVQGRTHE
jgi:uncharacterized protein YbjT (DUF2867 family)